ncbi:hypothetical protein PR003_g6694 [Phytophthora rubi]|uniref:Tc1-like transposase DDE domain-containing protein n=1 Tax=Phytophthora rubi TaxID=129364 RepID=A0A6A4FG64_9STRA|nr:hypothetical protein PR002_g6682 [Phytophthora rubi]KAE9042122.1 hypothetical protein PR001_g6334 [Phytophthora rubi]KAE9347891.1 hypothetical protein PR003_g6694 [Phytophthora rubi]
MGYTVKQTRIEPTTCNKLLNKTKRQIFARAMKKHQQDGDCIVYFDESNFNVNCKRGRGRAKKGTRATLVLPPSNGANLQVQFAVNSVMGQARGVRMEQNSGFIDDINRTFKASRKPTLSSNWLLIVKPSVTAPAWWTQTVSY